MYIDTRVERGPQSGRKYLKGGRERELERVMKYM